MTNNQEGMHNAEGEQSDRKFVIQYVPTHSTCQICFIIFLGVGLLNTAVKHPSTVGHNLFLEPMIIPIINIYVGHIF